MKFDEAMTAAKNKVSKESRQAELNELDNAAQELQEVNTAVAGMPLCRLPGCEKPVLNADLTGYKYCSRRHYYKATNGGDGERARAVLAAVLLASQADHAEGFAVFEREETNVYVIVDYEYYTIVFKLFNVGNATDCEHFDIFYGKYADRGLSDQRGGTDGGVQASGGVYAQNW